MNPMGYVGFHKQKQHAARPFVVMKQFLLANSEGGGGNKGASTIEMAWMGGGWSVASLS